MKPSMVNFNKYEVYKGDDKLINQKYILVKVTNCNLIFYLRIFTHTEFTKIYDEL